MLSKYIKSVFILFLILSFNINSFAAISVSDGSAFVTKSEFSSDLNNISSRLSQVENSLDAKIDSLVSSYLSRNGIWNGSDQLNFSTTEKTNGYRQIIGSTTSVQNNFSNVLIKGGSATTNIATGTLITSCNKSGMLIASFSIPGAYKTQVQTYHHTTVPAISGTTYHFDWVLNGSLGVYFSLFIGSAEKARFLIANSNGNYVLAGDLYYLTRFIYIFPLVANLSFFVAKNDKIDFRLFASYNYNQAMPTANTDKSGTVTGSTFATSQGCVVRVLDGQVY